MRATIVLIGFYITLGAYTQIVHLSSIKYSNREHVVHLTKASPFVALFGKGQQTKAISSAISLGGQSGTILVSQLALEAPNNPGSGGSQPASNATNSTSTTPPSTTSSTHDPNSDLDEPPLPPTMQDNSTNKVPNKDEPGGGGDGESGGKNSNKGNNSTGDNRPSSNERQNVELSVLWYSVFMVYVSFVKLIYHNVAIIKRNLTEPGILMIFGIIWELISRQLHSSLNVAPRFNSRIFFYLFLPSTVLESASILSNKWLLLNLLPILIHSIVGTLLYGSAIAFTIYSMSKQDMFNIGASSINGPPIAATTQTAASLFDSHDSSLRDQWLIAMNSSHQSSASALFSTQMVMNDDPEESTFLYEKSYVIDTPMLEVGNLTLADCLIFGSIMSSLDSNTMLGSFSMFQVNEKLYYLVLGESLMNNAVVLIMFNLLLDFLNASRLTVVKIYISIIQFFITLIGSIFVGLLLASVALLAVRLIKRFQVPSALTSYQNQCLAMIETLLVLKLAYLTYTLGSLAGLSSIVSLATFGVLQDQYIRLSLNLRSQLTFRQVVLATKTMGFSLVYPLLGMLLVDVAYASHYVQQANPQSAMSTAANEGGAQLGPAAAGGATVTSAATKLTNLANQAGLLWNFKFLSLITVISIVYRFGIVILLSLFCNLISNRKVKVRFREQLLMAYGGLKGPLAVALVHRLIEHEDHRDRLIRNKHLFMYTILFITLLSVIFKGAFIRPLVEKMQVSLHHPKVAASQKVVLFNTINAKVIESATHAVNSLMGRSKSPYERLFEFNESRIKPWLARDGSNTNWLGNFYDKLLLDETLDSNCFYKSTEEPIAGSFWHPRTQVGPAAELPKHRGSRTSSKLDTINEHGGGFIDDDELNAMNPFFGLSIREEQQQQQAPIKRQVRNGSRKARDSLTMAGGGGGSTSRERHSTGLREFVMLDLESADKDLNGRNRASRQSVSRVEPAHDSIDPLPRTLSFSSCDEVKATMARQSSSDKEGYLSQLAEQLDSRRRQQAASSSRKYRNDPAPSTDLRRRETLVLRTADGTGATSNQSRHERGSKPSKHSKHSDGNKHHRGRRIRRVDPNAGVLSSD